MRGEGLAQLGRLSRVRNPRKHNHIAQQQALFRGNPRRAKNLKRGDQCLAIPICGVGEAIGPKLQKFFSVGAEDPRATVDIFVLLRSIEGGLPGDA